MITLYGKRSCSTCADSLRFVEGMKAPVRFRDTEKEPLSVAEIEALIGDRPIDDFLATRSPTFRALGLAGKKLTRASAVALVREHVNLLRRPIFARGNERFVGFRENDLRTWIAGESAPPRGRAR
jgi:Spx/MgsR family transcriptional regulator